MFECIRKLTANYTEDEYKEYLEEPPQVTNTRMYPDLRECRGMKDLACMLADVADDTGYEPEFLWDKFNDTLKEYVEDGMHVEKEYRRAYIDVAEISYEQDW